MKTQKLIPILDYVLELQENEPKMKSFSDFGQLPEYKKKSYDLIHNYAKFLSQPLKLSMFVVCDENGNILEEPNNLTEENFNEVNPKIQGYYKAKENVLFEGFEIETDMHYQTKREIIWMPNKIDQVWRRLTYHTGEVETYFFIHKKNYDTLESIIKAGLTLTENAVKTINNGE